MHNLHIRATSRDGRRFDVAIEWFGDDGEHLTTEAQLNYPMDEAADEELRWYLEDFVDNPRRYGSEVPARVEARLEAIGDALFEALLDQDETARAIGRLLRSHVRRTTISIAADPIADWLIPWEFLRDPEHRFFYALQAQGFYRRFLDDREPPVSEPIPARILLVIARPGGVEDIGYRSTAESILTAADDAEEIPLRITTLRPPTFEHFVAELQTAHTSGDPYGLVHFDGHGVFDEEAAARFEQHAGYLAFEPATARPGPDLVTGDDVGAALAAAGVKALVLSSCRSAFAGSTTRVLHPALDRESSLLYPTYSVARDVLAAGVPCVVGMRYKSLAAAVATFVSPFYAALSRGQDLCTAVTEGRRELFRSPFRPSLGEEIRLQDWHVPVIYQQADAADMRRLGFRRPAQDTASDPAPANWNLPVDPPEFGFIGRDESFRALESAFVRPALVLLSGQAGVGKTALAVEYARWFIGTGGDAARLGYVSAADHTDAPSLLHAVDQVMGPGAGDGPGLLIIDDLDTWQGTGSDDWQSLSRALVAREEAGSRILLVSRTPDPPLGDVVAAGITVGAIDPVEQTRLAARILGQGGRQRHQSDELPTLTARSGGNPEYLILLAKQAARTGTTEAATGIGQHREPAIAALDPDLATVLRTSLERHLDHHFTAQEREHLAALQLMRKTAHVQVLWGLSTSKILDTAITGLSEEYWSSLLERCEQAGLATRQADRLYGVHPALRWYLEDAYRNLVASREADMDIAFVAAVATFSLMQSVHEEMGNAEARSTLAASRENFIACYHLAVQYCMNKGITHLAQALNTTCDDQDEAWVWIVQDMAHRFTSGFAVESDADETLRTIAYRYQIELLCTRQEWSAAEDVALEAVSWLTTYAQGALRRLEAGTNDENDHVISHLVILKHLQGRILDESGRPGSVDIYQQTLEMARKLGDGALMASAARKLAMILSTSRSEDDLDAALHLLERAAEIAPTDSNQDDVMLHYIRGQVAMKRYHREAEATSTHDARPRLDDAIDHFQDAVDALPDHDNRIGYILYTALGAAFDESLQEEKALAYYHAAIKIADRRGRERDIARVSYNLGATYYNLNRFAEADAHAQRALQIVQRPDIHSGRLLDDVHTLLARLAERQ